MTKRTDLVAVLARAIAARGTFNVGAARDLMGSSDYTAMVDAAGYSDDASAWSPRAEHKLLRDVVMAAVEIGCQHRHPVAMLAAKAARDAKWARTAAALRLEAGR